MPIADSRPANVRRFYALIPQRGGDGAADLAPLALARQLADRSGGEAHALLCGPAPATALERAREMGLDHAWIIPCEAAQPQPHQLAQIYAAALRAPGLADGLDRALLLVAARSDNEEFAGRLAARLDAAPLGRCRDFDIDASGTLTARRAAYGGRIETVLSCATGPAIASVRGSEIRAQSHAADVPAIHAAGTGEPSPTEVAPVRERATAGIAPALREHTLEGIDFAQPYALTCLPRTEAHASLDGARLVVSGGRGMGGEDGFRLLYALADRLGGALGASLPAVDAGWAPVARQVGQSGRYVGPDVYLAIGISGTPQHLAGIDPHTRIVAVNRDAEAPIFSAAELGIVAEWQTLLPQLLAQLEKAP
jgi:electron transfer flavoprotein alpha subunit